MAEEMRSVTEEKVTDAILSHGSLAEQDFSDVTCTPARPSKLVNQYYMSARVSASSSASKWPRVLSHIRVLSPFRNLLW